MKQDYCCYITSWLESLAVVPVSLVGNMFTFILKMFFNQSQI